MGRPIRGIVEGEHIFIWDEEFATHEEIIHKLRLHGDLFFYVQCQFKNGKCHYKIFDADSGLDGIYSHKAAFAKHPMIRRMLGGKTLFRQTS